VRCGLRGLRMGEIAPEVAATTSKVERRHLARIVVEPDKVEGVLTIRYRAPAKWKMEAAVVHGEEHGTIKTGIAQTRDEVVPGQKRPVGVDHADVVGHP